MLLAACNNDPAHKVVTTDPAKTAPLQSTGGCGQDGFLTAEFAGAIDAKLSLASNVMTCESMQRPDQAGLRLRMSAAVDSETLSLIIAIPELVAGEVAAELASTLTLTVEGSGRFFSTTDLDACWTDIREQEALSDSSDQGKSFQISGDVYCVAALGELNSAAAVAVNALSFSTRATWAKQ